MKLSVNNGGSAVYTGHGYVVQKLMTNLTTLGHSVLMNRAAPLEICFTHPNHYNFFGDNSYKVGYTAWESTALKEDWSEYMDLVDEFWVPSKFVKNVFAEYTDKNIYIFPHGVDDTFAPVERVVEDQIKFLHIGYPSYRKNTDGVINTFLDMYAGRKDVHLTIKGYSRSYLPIREKNITFISDHYTYADLRKLMGDHHIFLYPSWGEGFGLMPLQAMATGMPAIFTHGWADYENLSDMIISSDLVYNPWELVHPGKMFRPDMNEFANLMEYSLLNIDTILKKYSNQAPEIHKKYQWIDIIKSHFDSVESRLML